MNKEIANLALQFLGRCPLKGAEVPAFLEVISALEAIMNLDEGAPHSYASMQQSDTDRTV